MIDIHALSGIFQQHFGWKPALCSRAPGRVNLIGEHTDYNGGLVMPAAIDREAVLLANRRIDNEWHIYSADYNVAVKVDAIQAAARQSQNRWVNYLLAVRAQFEELGHAVPGLDMVLQGDVPQGSGLSSSAAIEVATATLLNEITGAGLDGVEIARLSQAAEHSPFVGVQCGIMDQFVSSLGRKSQLVKIDCHTLDYEYVPLDSSRALIVIIDSGKRRGLVDSAYNQRRRECQEGFQTICRLEGRLYESLSHVPFGVYTRHGHALTGNQRKRLRHILSENQRVRDFQSALAANDLSAAGKLMDESHRSLRDDYEVSCKELDLIVEIANGQPGIFGCRMTGAGFGGCAVALVKPGQENQFAEYMTEAYEKESGLTPQIYVTPAAPGATFKRLEATLAAPLPP